MRKSRQPKMNYYFFNLNNNKDKGQNETNY